MDPSFRWDDEFSAVRASSVVLTFTSCDQLSHCRPSAGWDPRSNCCATPDLTFSVQCNSPASLHGLIDNAASQELQLLKILDAVKAAGITCELVSELEKFNKDRLNKLVE